MSASSIQPRSGDPGEDLRPTRLVIPDSAYVAPNAVLVGEVTLGRQASVWYGCVLRGDLEPIRVGAQTNVQDLTVVHVDRGMPAEIGRRVTIGHRAVIHGCRIDDDVLIGMGAVLLSGCRVGSGAIVAAGAVVAEGQSIPAGTVAAGVPARVRGPVSPALRARIADGTESYLACSREYLGGRLGGGPFSGRGAAE